MAEKKKLFLRRRTVYLIVGGVTLLLRLSIFPDWGSSALGTLHLLPGLDMKTHIDAAAMLAQGKEALTVYRALLLIYHNPEQLILFQLLTGVATALLTAFCAMRIFGKKIYAIGAGLAAGLYGPALMYELTLLQESVTLLIAFAAFSAMLWVRKRRFDWVGCLAFGLLLGLTGTGRAVGLPLIAVLFGWAVYYQYRRRREWLRSAGRIAAGMLTVWVIFGTFNYCTTNWPLPFYISNGRFLLTMAGQNRLVSWQQASDTHYAAREQQPAENAPRELPLLLRLPVNALKKLPHVFSGQEIPDNINYYFFAGTVRTVRHMLPPVILFSAALAGMLLLLVGRKIGNRDALPLLYILPLALCIAAYNPLGRYRLILYPAIALLGCYPFYWGGRNRSRQIVAIALLVLAVQLMRLGTDGPFRRASDYASWALALEKMPKPSEDPLKYHLGAYEYAPGNPVHLVRAMNILLQRGAYGDAGKVLAVYPREDSYFFYYCGLLELGRGRAADAEKMLAKVKAAELTGLEIPALYYHAESLRLTGRSAEAAAKYRAAAAKAGNAQQKKMIGDAMLKLEKQTENENK